MLQRQNKPKVGLKGSLSLCRGRRSHCQNKPKVGLKAKWVMSEYRVYYRQNKPKVGLKDSTGKVDVIATATSE